MKTSIVLPVLLVAFPMNMGGSLPALINDEPSRFKQAIAIANFLAPAYPFVLAGLSGAALALFELLTAFQRNVGRALRSGWGWAILAYNAASAVGVYCLVRFALGVESGIVTALIVGFTFPVIIRSRFTLYRRPGDHEDAGLQELSLKLDQFYSSLQALCFTQVNTMLAEFRKATAELIKLKFTASELEVEIRNLIASGVLPDRRDEYESKLNAILTTYRDADQHHRLAIFFMDISTPKAIAQLVKPKKKRA